METEDALSPPAVDLSLLLLGHLLLLPASVCQPAEAAGEAEAALRTGLFVD